MALWKEKGVPEVCHSTQPSVWQPYTRYIQFRVPAGVTCPLLRSTALVGESLTSLKSCPRIQLGGILNTNFYTNDGNYHPGKRLAGDLGKVLVRGVKYWSAKSEACSERCWCVTCNAT